MTSKPTILIIDDDLSNIEILNALLEERYEVSFALSGEEGLEIASEISPDLILLDIVMPQMDGFEVCRRLKADAVLADVPVIFMTGLGETEDEVRGLTLGAIDYVTKPVQPIVLQARVRNHVDLKRLRDKLAQMAVTDVLTGLSNRRRLEEALNIQVPRLAETEEWLSVILLDIDFFKQFNDTYGHPAGDRCIAMVAAALNRAVRHSSDLLARYGGEEFACILPRADAEAAMAIAQDIQSHIERLNIPHERSDISPSVTVSIGVATARCKPQMSPDLWLAYADGQLYKSKVGGRNTITSVTFRNVPGATQSYPLEQTVEGRAARARL